MCINRGRLCIHDWHTRMTPLAGAPVDVHTMFGLTYANYLVLNRTLLQSMPEDWQHRFTALVDEFDRAFANVDRAPQFTVSARDFEGRFIKDPVPHYNRGRAFVAPHVDA